MAGNTPTTITTITTQAHIHDVSAHPPPCCQYHTTSLSVRQPSSNPPRPCMCRMHEGGSCQRLPSLAMRMRTPHALTVVLWRLMA